MATRNNTKYLPGLLKFPELALAVILLVLTRVGSDGDQLGWGDSPTEFIFGLVLAYGFPAFIGAQLIAFLMGERSPILSVVISSAMAVSYLAGGILQFIAFEGTGWWYDEIYDTAMAMASLAVIQAIIMAVDAVLSAKYYSDSRQTNATKQPYQQPQMIYQHPHMAHQPYAQVVQQPYTHVVQQYPHSAQKHTIFVNQ